MDAGARGRRLLQRREYRAKVSEFIPKELEDHVVYENPNTNLFSDKTSDRIINTINTASDKLKKFDKNRLGGMINKVFGTSGGSNYTPGGKVPVNNSFEREGEMLEANSAQIKAMHDAKVKKMEDDKVASKKKDVKEGSAYGITRGSGKASGAMKDYLDKKKKEKKKVDEACWKGYEKKGMKTMFGKRYPNCVKKTKKEEVQLEAKVDQGKDDASKINTRNQRAFGNRRGSKGGGHTGDDMEARRYNTEKGRGVKMRGKKDKTPINYKKRDSDKAIDQILGRKPKKEPTYLQKKGREADIKRKIKSGYYEEVEVAEDMKGMSQKSGDKRSTESGAGMTAQGVAKYNRRTGGNLKTAVTTPPSKLKPGSKAAKRRKSFCARSKSWTGPRGKAARRRWNCSYEPELPMIIDEKKKLFNTAPLSDRVSNWSKKINEGDVYVKSNRNRLTGLPNLGKGDGKKSTEKKITGVNYGAMAQSYEPQGEMIEAKKYKGKINRDVLKKNPKLDPNKPGDYIRLKRMTAKADKIDERKMTPTEKERKEKYVKGMKKDKGGFTKRYGKDGKSVMYATATKMAMKEESCGKGQYYCYDDKKCKPIPEGMKVGKDGMLVKEDFYKKKFDVRKGGYQKTNKMTKSNKRSGDSKAQYRQVHKDLAKENIFQGVKGDGYLGKTPIPNPIRLAKDVVDTVNRQQKNRIDKLNKISPNSASINIPKPFNKTVSPASTRYLGLRNEGSLHKWFKGSKSKDGKPGWVNVVTGGTCASDKPGEGTPKCVSSSKRASMTKAERLSASRRKKKADPGQQSKTGAAKPTYVATDSKKKK